MTNPDFIDFNDDSYAGFYSIDKNSGLNDQSKVVGSGRFRSSPSRENGGLNDQSKVVGSGRFRSSPNGEERDLPNGEAFSNTMLESIIRQLSIQMRNHEVGYTGNANQMEQKSPRQFYEEHSALYNHGLSNHNAIDSFPKEISDLTSLLNQFQLQERLSSPAGANLPSARRSPTSYLCHICNKPGHAIKECPGVRPRTQCYTPYQGTKRCFGEFKCERCDRTWMSGNSWANESQLCKKCSHPCFPFRQASLNKPDGLDRSDQSRVHPQELCSRCKTLGYYCRSNASIRCHVPQTPQLPPAREPPFPIASPKSWLNRQL